MTISSAAMDTDQVLPGPILLCCHMVNLMLCFMKMLNVNNPQFNNHGLDALETVQSQVWDKPILIAFTIISK